LLPVEWEEYLKKLAESSSRRAVADRRDDEEEKGHGVQEV
jgi:hypothetical protein